MKPEQVLVERGLLSEDALREAEARAGEASLSLFDSIVEGGSVSGEEVGWHVADAFELPFVRLHNVNISRELASRVGHSCLAQRGIVPLQPEEFGLTVAVADPTRCGPVASLQSLFGVDVPVFLAIAESAEIRGVLEQLFGPGDASTVAPSDQEDRPRPFRFMEILLRAIRSGGDLLRVDPLEGGAVVRVREAGVARPIARLPEPAYRDMLRRARQLFDVVPRAVIETRVDGLPVRLRHDLVDSVEGRSLLVEIDPPRGGRPDPVEIDRAIEVGLEGPLLLIAHSDPGGLRHLTDLFLRGAGELGAPVLWVGRERDRPPGAALVLPPDRLDDSRRLRPRTAVVAPSALSVVQLQHLARFVPSVVALRTEVTARAALGTVPGELRSLVRGALGPNAFVEVSSWT